MRALRYGVLIAALGLTTVGCVSGGGSGSSSGVSSLAPSSEAVTSSSGHATSDRQIPSPAPGSSPSDPGSGLTDTNTVTLSWTAPVQRADGTPLSMQELAGYSLNIGTEPGNYTRTIQIEDAYTMDYAISELAPGTYYVTVQALDADGRISDYSQELTITI